MYVDEHVCVVLYYYCNNSILFLLSSGETSKNAVVRYVSQMSEECARLSQDLEMSPHERDVASDDSLLWHFLALMCQQNGVLVPSDISELLTRESSLLTSKSPIRGVGVGGVKETEREDDALNEFRQFLLSGRKKVSKWFQNESTTVVHVDVQCTIFPQIVPAGTIKY